MKKQILLFFYLFSFSLIDTGTVPSSAKNELKHNEVQLADKIFRLVELTKIQIINIFKGNDFLKTILEPYRIYKNKKHFAAKMQELKLEMQKIYVPLLELNHYFKKLFPEETRLHAMIILNTYLFASVHNSTVLQKIIYEQKMNQFRS